MILWLFYAAEKFLNCSHTHCGGKIQKDSHTFCLIMLKVKIIYSLTLPSMLLSKIFNIKLVNKYCFYKIIFHLAISIQQEVIFSSEATYK